eukprot:Skav227194  [mRNA]  locus=scaffold2048:183148:190039:- [translate_table: standard]
MAGTGITSCKVVKDRRAQDALAQDAVVFFEVKQQKGSVFGFHSLKRSHQSLQEECRKEDERLAFQLACPNLAMDVVDQFKADHRPRGWQQGDFNPPGPVLAWTLSSKLQMDFIRWLVPKEGQAAARPPALNHSLLLDLARAHGQKIAALDPSISQEAGHRFPSQRFKNDDGRVRYGHDTISNKFADGRTISGLASSLRLGDTDPLQIPALVAVKYKGCYFVTMGNRRLWAFRNCGRTIEFNMVDSGSHVQLNVGVATVESLTKLLTLARSQKGLALHLSAHACCSEKGDIGLVLEDAKGFSHVLWKKNLEDSCACKGEASSACWAPLVTCLRNHPETEIGDQDPHDGTIGQRESVDQATLQQLCGEACCASAG